jgi:hypothetical protein
VSKKRLLLPRNDLGAGLVNGKSDDGGLDEFCGAADRC